MSVDRFAHWTRETDTSADDVTYGGKGGGRTTTEDEEDEE